MSDLLDIYRDHVAQVLKGRQVELRKRLADEARERRARRAAKENRP